MQEWIGLRLENAWSVMLVVLFSSLVCHKAGLISSTGVPWAPSVSSSQLLSYYYAHLGHFDLFLEHFVLISYNFKCTTLETGNGT